MEGSDSSSLVVDSANIFARREIDVQQHESSRIEESNNTDADHGRSATVGDGVDIEEAESTADGYDRLKLVGKDKDINVQFGEASNTDSQQLAELKLTDQPRRAGDDEDARAAAYNSRLAAACCRCMMQNTLYVLNVGKDKVNEALAKAEEAEQFHEATRYGALANKYNVAIELATAGTRQIEVAAESAENASIKAYLLADQMTPASTETVSELQQMLSIAYCAANSANTAAIAAYKIEYSALKTMKNCLKDIDSEYLEFEKIVSLSEEEAIDKRTQTFVIACICNAISILFGILILASVLTQVKSMNNPNDISLVTIGSIMIVVPVVYLLYQACMYCRNKLRDVLDRKNRNIITQIDKRLHELEKYFESKNVPLEDEQ